MALCRPFAVIIDGHVFMSILTTFGLHNWLLDIVNILRRKLDRIRRTFWFCAFVVCRVYFDIFMLYSLVCLLTCMGSDFGVMTIPKTTLWLMPLCC